MRLALCIDGTQWLKEGRVYEITESFQCGNSPGASFVEAAGTGADLGICAVCGHRIGSTWFSRRFVPINDVDVKDEERDELFAVS